MKKEVFKFQYPEFTTEELIVSGIVQRDELFDVGHKAQTDYANKKYREEHGKHWKKILDEAFDKTRLYVCVWEWDGCITLRLPPSSANDLREVRKVLRKIFKRWSDVVTKVEASQNTIDVYYKPTFEIPVPITIEVDYNDEDVPKGVIKSSCRITTEVNTYRSIVCSK